MNELSTSERLRLDRTFTRYNISEISQDVIGKSLLRLNYLMESGIHMRPDDERSIKLFEMLDYFRRNIYFPHQDTFKNCG